MSAAEILAEGCFFCDEPLPLEVGERAAAADYNPHDLVRSFPMMICGECMFNAPRRRE